MMKLTKLVIQQLRDQGLTYAQIGKQYSLSRQRVHAIYTGYMKAYQKGESYKMYKRHYLSHSMESQLDRACFYCLKETSIGYTNEKY